MDIQGFQIKMGSKPSNLHVAQVHTCVTHMYPCVNYEFTSHELKITGSELELNYKWNKSELKLN
jgi:hypothetical protein